MEQYSLQEAKPRKYTIPLKNPVLESNRRPTGPGILAPAVQPQLSLTFEHSSQWEETFVIRKISTDWDDEEQYGIRSCFVAVSVKPENRILIARPEINRKYILQVSSDAKECARWQLLNIVK